jgi:hypothetical protein
VTAQPRPSSDLSRPSTPTHPTKYHLRCNGVRLSYFPTGAGFLNVDDPIIVVYQDTHRSMTFRDTQADCGPVANLGTCVTMTLETTVDAESITATVLIPTVVLAGFRATGQDPHRADHHRAQPRAERHQPSSTRPLHLDPTQGRGPPGRATAMTYCTGGSNQRVTAGSP